MEETLQKVKELLQKKNHDYGTANLQIMGLLGVATRIMDKAMRLANLSFKDAQVEETIEDTLLDIAGYAVLAYTLYKEGKLTGIGILGGDICEGRREAR